MTTIFGCAATVLRSQCSLSVLTVCTKLLQDGANFLVYVSKVKIVDPITESKRLDDEHGKSQFPLEMSSALFVPALSEAAGQAASDSDTEALNAKQRGLQHAKGRIEDPLDWNARIKQGLVNRSPSSESARCTLSHVPSSFSPRGHEKGRSSRAALAAHSPRKFADFLYS